MSMPNLVAITTSSAAALQGLAEQRLGGAGAVDVGRVEEGDAVVERGVDHRRVSDFVHLRPKLLQPRPTTETTSPDAPSRR